MPSPGHELHDRLSRYRQLNLTVTGRKSGRAITVPIWFVYEDGTLYLLPVHGTDTQWYKNVLKDAKVRLEARGATATAKVEPVRGDAAIKSIVDKFRAKYGAGDVKKYYSKFDAALTAKVT